MATQDPPQLELGLVQATPAAMQLLELHAAEHSLDPQLVLMHLVGRHAAHDWGTIDAEDAKANTRALVDGSRVLSTYSLDGQPVWVITDAEDDHGSRACTTVLLPGDY